MDILDQSTDNPFNVVVGVSDKTMPDPDEVAYLPPKVFDDGLAQENTYAPFQDDSGNERFIRLANSHDPKQQKVRFSSTAKDGFGDLASINFDPDTHQDVDANLPDNLRDYKDFLIQNITAGAQDLTYGPGSPNPTGADMREFVGARDNRLRTGQVALQQSDYNLFTPEERQKYNIADNRPGGRGRIERYYGPEMSGQPMSGEEIRSRMAGYPQIAGDVTNASMQAAGPRQFPTKTSQDSSGTSYFSDGSKVFNDGTIATPMGNQMKLTSRDGKVKYVTMDPMKQPVPDVPDEAYQSEEGKKKALDSLSQADRVAVEEYAKNQRSGMTRYGRTDPAYTRLAPYVKLVNPDHKASDFQVVNQARLEFGSTKPTMPGGRIQSFNQAIMHTGNLWDLTKKLPGDDSRVVNEFKNVVSKYVKGEPFVTDAEQQLGFVVNEIGKALKGSAIDQADINRMLSNISTASSRDQIESNIKNVLLKTIEGGLESLNGAYKSSTNDDLPTRKVIYPETADALRKIGVKEFVHRPMGDSAATAPAGSPDKSYPQPNDAQVQLLKDTPSLRKKFDDKFGPGASDKVLGNE